MEKNRSIIILSIIFFVPFEKIQKIADARGIVTRNRVQIQWVPEIEETKDPVKQTKNESSTSDSYVCENFKNEEQMVWCDEALKVFIATYTGGRTGFYPDPHLEPVRWYKLTDKVDKKTKIDFVQACKCPVDWQIYLRNDLLRPGDEVIAFIKRPKYLLAVEPDEPADNAIAAVSGASTSTCTRRHKQNDDRSTAVSTSTTSNRDQQGSRCGTGGNCCDCTDCCSCVMGCLGDMCSRPTSYSSYSYRNAPRTQADVDRAFWDGWIMNDVCSLFVRCLGLVCENMGSICEHVGNNMETYGGCIGEICGTCCEDTGCCIEFVGHCLNPNN